jgi:GTPase SAR1 family protein
MRYCEDSFQSDLLSTVGVDFKIKKINQNGKDICLNIWDTAGQ